MGLPLQSCAGGTGPTSPGKRHAATECLQAGQQNADVHHLAQHGDGDKRGDTVSTAHPCQGAPVLQVADRKAISQQAGGASPDPPHRLAVDHHVEVLLAALELVVDVSGRVLVTAGAVALSGRLTLLLTA